MLEELESSASNLAAARLAADDCTELLGAATAERDNVLARIKAFEADRASIIAARSRGEDSADHAGRLILIAADLEILGQLLADDQAKVAAALAKSQEANAALVAAEQKFTRVEDDVMLHQLVEHADAVGAVLLDTATEVVALCKKLGIRNAWAASHPLSDLIRRLDLNRAGLVQ